MTPTPNPVPDAQPEPQKEAPKPPAVSNGKNILIVEDEKPLSHALEMKLKNQGFATKVVTNGNDALEELGKTTYHMILLDLIMPVMDGFAMLQEMKTRNISVPVIVLSNLGQDEDREKTKVLGAIDYFVKSNTPISEILDRIKKAF